MGAKALITRTVTCPTNIRGTVIGMRKHTIVPCSLAKAVGLNHNMTDMEENPFRNTHKNNNKGIKGMTTRDMVNPKISSHTTTRIKGYTHREEQLKPNCKGKGSKATDKRMRDLTIGMSPGGSSYSRGNIEPTN